MIKRLYLANGALLAPLSSTSEDVAVDTTIATLLGAILGLGDHCYLTLIDGDALEVVKVRKDYSGFRVDRGQDGTRKRGFPTGARIIYRLTGIEIKDATTAVNYSIYASGYGFATVTGGNGSWSIGVEAIHADTVGGIETRTEGNELVIFDKIGMFGCCNNGVTGAPFIPGPYFYLTSMLYPQESIEIITPQPKDKLKNPIPPINFDIPWWLLVQPSMIEKYLGRAIAALDWNLFGSSAAFAAPVERYISRDITPLEWNIFGGAVVISAPPEMYVGRDAYPLEMFLFGNAVEYDKALDAYIGRDISMLDWTLS